MGFEGSVGLPSDSLLDMIELQLSALPNPFNEPPPPPPPAPQGRGRREATEEDDDDEVPDDKWFDLNGDGEDEEDEVAWNLESDLDWAEEAELVASGQDDDEDLGEEDFFYEE